VPNNLEALLSIRGVGRKTANLVLGYAFDIPAICVDVHVHRISNRLGLVQTKTPYETEMALQQLLPSAHWIEFNQILVAWGQNHCFPVNPRCDTCPIATLCKQTGVKKQ
jgi:endonuclease-3